METIHKRHLEFRELNELVYNNPIVNKFVEMYAHGVIVTKEETLFQMVRELAKTREEYIENLKQELAMKTIIFQHDRNN